MVIDADPGQARVGAGRWFSSAPTCIGHSRFLSLSGDSLPVCDGETLLVSHGGKAQVTTGLGCNLHPHRGRNEAFSLGWAFWNVTSYHGASAHHL